MEIGGAAPQRFWGPAASRPCYAAFQGRAATPMAEPVDPVWVSVGGHVVLQRETSARIDAEKSEVKPRFPLDVLGFYGERFDLVWAMTASPGSPPAETSVALIAHTSRVENCRKTLTMAEFP